MAFNSNGLDILTSAARQQWLDFALETVEQAYGSFERYVLDGLGIGQGAIDTLKAGRRVGGAKR